LFTYIYNKLKTKFSKHDNETKLCFIQITISGNFHRIYDIEGSHNLVYVTSIDHVDIEGSQRFRGESII